MRLEAERYRINDSVGNRGHVDMVSVGLVYRFGARHPARRVDGAGARTAAGAGLRAPAPAPRRRTGSPRHAGAGGGDAREPVGRLAVRLRQFGRQGPGKVALDKLSADLRGVQYDSIKVTGHTDRLGSASYNDGPVVAARQRRQRLPGAVGRRLAQQGDGQRRR
jgi:OOP family OmpA-OmpF porin